MGPRQEILRMSCNGVEVRLRINPDNAWVVIRKPGQEPFYSDIAESELTEVLEQYHSINGSPARFQAFVASLACEPAEALAEEKRGQE